MLIQSIIRQSAVSDELTQMKIKWLTTGQPPISCITAPDEAAVAIQIWTRPLNYEQHYAPAEVDHQLTTSTRLTGLPGGIILDMKQIFKDERNGYRLTKLYFEIRHEAVHFRDEGSLLFKASPIGGMTWEHAICGSHMHFVFDADDEGFIQGDITILGRA